MEGKYESLLLNSEIYPTPFIEKFGSSGPHWYSSSFAQRERSLCHDMICVLLCNMEPMPDLKEEYVKRMDQLEPAAKRFKGPDPVPDEDEVYEETYSESSEEEDYEDTTGFTGRHDGFAYQCLEGNVNESAYQMNFAAKWGVRTDKKYDAVHIPTQKFIEVKTTVNPQHYIENPYSTIQDGPNFGLVVVDIIQESCHYVGMDPMPGEAKALNWLAKRNGVKRALEIEDGYCEDLDSNQVLFGTGNMGSVLAAMGELRIAETAGIGIPPSGTYDTRPLNPFSLFAKLKDPLKIEGEKSVVYKGKLTPMFWCNPIRIEGDTDFEAIEYFMNEIGVPLAEIRGKEPLHQAVVTLKQMWDERVSGAKQFGFMDLKEGGAISDPEVLKYIGVGQKKRVHLPGAENVRQEEYEPIVTRKYDPWIEKLYGAMHLPSSIGGTALSLGTEEKSKVMFHQCIGDWVDYILKIVAGNNTGLLINQMQNFYSRISGSYNTTFGNKTTHSKIACIPLKVNISRNGEKEWYCSGLAFRGPHHTRNATDKMTILIIERVTEEMPETMYDISKTCYVKSREGKMYVIRQESIKKIDGTHITFLNNALFLAINSIGELLQQHPLFNTNETEALRLIKTFGYDSESMAFVMNRIADGVVMGIIGNARDEGFLSVYRKFIMAMIAMRKREICYTFDVDGLCDKANECIIDNPLSMHLLISLRYSLAVMGTHE